WIVKRKCAGKQPINNAVRLSGSRDQDHCRRDRPSRPTAVVNAPSDQNAPYRLLFPSRGGTRPTRMREHENLMPYLSKACAQPRRLVRDSSDQRHGFWWAIGKTGLAAGNCDHLGEHNAHAREVSWRGIENVRNRPGQRMQRTALIMQILSVPLTSLPSCGCPMTKLPIGERYISNG